VRWSSRPLARLPIVKCVGEPLSRRRSGVHLSASRSPIARRSGWSRGRGSPQPYRRRQRVSSSILMFSAGVEPPHPGGLSWSGPGVPAGPAKPTIIHLLETTNEGKLGSSGSFGNLISRVKAQSGACAGNIALVWTALKKRQFQVYEPMQRGNSPSTYWSKNAAQILLGLCARFVCYIKFTFKSWQQKLLELRFAKDRTRDQNCIGSTLT
jgi:hypothetical protein